MIYKILRNGMEITTFREEKTQKTVSVFVGAALPGFVWLGKINLRVQLRLQGPEFGEFGAVVQADAIYRHILEHPADGVFRQLCVPFRKQLGF